MDILLRGGILIWPILLESVLALWVILDRAYYCLAVLPKRRRALHDVVQKSGDVEKLDSDDSLGDFTKAVIRAKEEGVLNQSLLNRQAENLINESEKYLSILHVVAQSAPLLGLLGTVMGMIDAFIEIQNLGGQVNASDLAGGIWEALITTAAGLTVAIPALIAYIGFGRVADRYSQQVDSAVSQIVHKFSRSGLEIE
jgi:biopolymer transport protein ExbB